MLNILEKWEHIFKDHRNYADPELQSSMIDEIHQYAMENVGQEDWGAPELYEALQDYPNATREIMIWTLSNNVSF